MAKSRKWKKEEQRDKRVLPAVVHEMEGAAVKVLREEDRPTAKGYIYSGPQNGRGSCT
jgi:hypothetical protein